MNLNDCLIWIKESRDQYNEAYEKSPSVIRMPIILFPLRVFFTLLCIASAFLLISSLFFNLAEVMSHTLEEPAQKTHTVAQTAHSADIAILINSVLGITFIFSILVLWLLKQVKDRNRYIRKVNFFWFDRFDLIDKMAKVEEEKGHVG